MAADHASDGLTLWGVPGLPEFRPGDDLAAALADALAGSLADGDVVVVTSKVLSKVEGRLVRVPTDPDERDTARRALVDRETVRLLATKGRTKIVANPLGIVQAAAGIDASNVAGDEVALLPEDPDASAAALRAALRERLGVDVAVVVTDTMGRTWRVGQTDAAIGAAGLEVVHAYGGAVDRQGNELVVTEVAVADEVAAAADLVKGKLGGVPVAVVRGLPAALRSETARGRDLVRSVDEDLFSVLFLDHRGATLWTTHPVRVLLVLGFPLRAFRSRFLSQLCDQFLILSMKILLFLAIALTLHFVSHVYLTRIFPSNLASP